MSRFFFYAITVGFAAVLFFSVPHSTDIDDEFFHLFDYTGKQTTSSGNVNIPFHCRAAANLQIHGTADKDFVTDVALKNLPDYHPVLDNKNRVPTIFWVVEYANTDGGPYIETLITFAISKHANTVLDTNNDAALARAMLYEPRMETTVWKLWLNETLPIDYGREVLGYDKFKMTPDSHVSLDAASGVPTSWSINVDGKPIQKGKFVPKTGPSQWLYLAKLYLVDLIPGLGGLRNVMRVLTEPYVLIPVVTPTGILNEKLYASTGVAPRSLAMFRGDTKFYSWDPNTDSIEWGSPELEAMDFKPHCVHSIPNLKMVLLPPYNTAAE